MQLSTFRQLMQYFQINAQLNLLFVVLFGLVLDNMWKQLTM